MKPFFILSFLIFLCFSGTESYSREEPIEKKTQSVSLQSGFMIGGDFALNFRYYIDYQRQWKEKWSWGLSFETNQIGIKYSGERRFGSDEFWGLLSLNSIYKIQPFGNKIYWKALAGVGGVYLQWKNNREFGMHVNLGLTIEILLIDNVHFVASPLIVLFPPSRLYFAPFFPFNPYHVKVLTVLPLGLRVSF